MIMTEPSASSEQQEQPADKIMPAASTMAAASGHHSGNGNTLMATNNLTWEKLSPSEFQQLQDFAACEFY